MCFFNFPAPLTDDHRHDLRTLWEEYWKLIEQLRLLNEDLGTKLDSTVSSAVTVSGSEVKKTSVPASASIDAAGLISYKNSSGATLFILQLPLYTGGVE